MAPAHNHREENNRNHVHNRTHASIKCMQINLHNSRTASEKIKNLFEQDRSDIIFTQKPFLYNRKIPGISPKNIIYTSHEGKSRAAIVINNRNIDAVLITQLSNPGSAFLRLEYNGHTFYAASMYFDITEEIEKGLEKIDKMLEFTEGNGLIITIDSNARSAA